MMIIILSEHIFDIFKIFKNSGEIEHMFSIIIIERYTGGKIKMMLMEQKELEATKGG